MMQRYLCFRNHTLVGRTEQSNVERKVLAPQRTPTFTPHKPSWPPLFVYTARYIGIGEIILRISCVNFIFVTLARYCRENRTLKKLKATTTLFRNPTNSGGDFSKEDTRNVWITLASWLWRTSRMKGFSWSLKKRKRDTNYLMNKWGRDTPSSAILRKKFSRRVGPQLEFQIKTVNTR